MSFPRTSISALSWAGVVTVLFMVVTLGLSQESTAGMQSEGWTPIQLKYGKNIALFSNRRSVYGIRMSLIEAWPSVDVDQSSPSWERDMPDWYRAHNIVGVDLSLSVAYPIKMHGIQLSPVFAVSSEMTGIAIGGLCAGAKHDMRGIALGAGFSGSQGSMRGIAAGLLAGAGGDMHGIAVGGLMSGVRNDMTGIALGGIATVTDNMIGLQSAFVMNAADTCAGAQIAVLWNNQCAEMKGLQICLLNACQELKGIQVGALNCGSALGGWEGGSIGGNEGIINGAQVGLINDCGTLNGLQVGILNACETLHGVQFGLINVASRNLCMPIINARF